MQHSGMQIVDVDWMLYDLESKIVCSSVRDASFNTAASEKHGKPMRVVIAPVLNAILAACLDDRSPSKFTSADDHGLIQKAPRLEVLNERRNWLV